MRGNYILTDSKLRAAKPREKPYKLADGGGLYLLVKPSGSKYWRVKYRVQGREKLLSLGVYPDTSLATARERHAATRSQLAGGTDPGVARAVARREKRLAAANSFEAVANDWHAAKLSQWTPGHAENVRLRLERELYPWLGPRPIGEIGAADILECAERVANRGALHTAKRVIGTAGAVCRHAVRKRLITSDPSRDLRDALPAEKVRHHAAITDTARAAELLCAMDGYHGTLQVRTALQLAAMLFVRPGELRLATWDEFDLDAVTWTIPARRMKMRQEHLVPLATQAVKLLRELHPWTYRAPSSYVFQGQRSSSRPMSENTINAALRYLGFDGNTMSGHGFRAMARTILDEHLRFSPDWIEAQLAHDVPDRLGRAYNRTAHLDGRRKMMQAWADYLDKLRDPKANLVAVDFAAGSKRKPDIRSG